MTALALVEFRCHVCGKLIFKVSDLAGVQVEAQCPRCSTLIRATWDSDDRQAGEHEPQETS